MRPQNYILALITFPALLISDPLLAVPLNTLVSSALCDNPIIPVGSLGTLPSLLPIGSSNEADRKDLELRDRSLQLAASGQVEQALQVVQGIEDESGKYWTLFEMAVKLAEAGQYNQASQVILFRMIISRILSIILSGIASLSC